MAELGFDIESEDTAEELIVINDPAQGINNLVIDCEAPIVILEQYIVNTSSEAAYKRLLQMNRTLVHGAFVLDDGGERILFRDTLQLENLDLNELEGSINALSMALAENASELIGFAKA
mgnify:CR=1 FL=1